MRYKVNLTWLPNPSSGFSAEEIVNASNELEAQDVAVSLASAVYDNLTRGGDGHWVVNSLELIEDENEGTEDATLAPPLNESYSTYSSMVVSVSQDTDDSAIWTSTDYSPYYVGSFYETYENAGTSAGSGESGYTTYSSYVGTPSEEEQTDANQPAESSGYTSYSSFTTPAQSNQTQQESMSSSQIAGYTTFVAPANFNASVSYQTCLRNGYLPYRSWRIPVCPGRKIIV